MARALQFFESSCDAPVSVPSCWAQCLHFLYMFLYQFDGSFILTTATRRKLKANVRRMPVRQIQMYASFIGMKSSCSGRTWLSSSSSGLAFISGSEHAHTGCGCPMLLPIYHLPFSSFSTSGQYTKAFPCVGSRGFVQYTWSRLEFIILPLKSLSSLAGAAGAASLL